MLGAAWHIFEWIQTTTNRCDPDAASSERRKCRGTHDVTKTDHNFTHGMFLFALCLSNIEGLQEGMHSEHV